MKIPTLLLPLITLALTASCDSVKDQPRPAPNHNLERIWAGGAELNHYDLKQERYGDIVSGQAMMIFVREPFLKDRQVKDESGKGDYQVLKLIATRDFRTGVYPYRTMVSVFQPLDREAVGEALKVTTSVQDWCGHVFMQTNRRAGKTHTSVASYFEQEEGTSSTEDAAVLLEDEIWTALRINPDALPTGELQVVPGSLAVRFSHMKPIALRAVAQWKEGTGKSTRTYEVHYPESGRTLAIDIQNHSPFSIEGWRETNADGLLSSGTLNKRLTDVEYWKFNKDPKGIKLRRTLNLD